MVFGKLNSEKISRDERIHTMARNGVTCYAVIPARLENGQYIWLEKYHARLCATFIHEYNNTWWFLIPYLYKTRNYTLQEALVMKLKGGEE